MDGWMDKNQCVMTFPKYTMVGTLPTWGMDLATNSYMLPYLGECPSPCGLLTWHKNEENYLMYRRFIH